METSVVSDKMTDYFFKEKYNESVFYQGYHIADDQKERGYHSI